MLWAVGKEKEGNIIFTISLDAKLVLLLISLSILPLSIIATAISIKS